MATIVGGVAASHTPTIGFAFDRDKRSDPAWTAVFEAFDPVRVWLERARPDVLFFVYNDHVTSFFFDQYPTFALSVAAEHRIADEGFGPRPLPPVRGDAQFAWHVAHSLVDDEFDITLCQDLPLDHGALTPISALWPDHSAGWPCAVLPLAVNVLQFPVPGPRRLYKLGQAIRRAVEGYAPESGGTYDVVVLGTGGLSHQLHGERFGYRNYEWDMEFLDLLERDPERLASLRLQDYIDRGGAEGAEVIMWLAMRGALSPEVRCTHRNYHAPLHTGFAQVIYEDAALEADLAGQERAGAELAVG